MKVKFFHNLISSSKSFAQIAANKPLIPTPSPDHLSLYSWSNQNKVLEYISSESQSVQTQSPIDNISNNKFIKQFKFENYYLSTIDQELTVKLDQDPISNNLHFQQLNNLGISHEIIPFDQITTLSQDERNNWLRNKMQIPSVNYDFIDQEMMFRKVNTPKFIQFFKDGEWNEENSMHPLLQREDIPLYNDDTRGGTRPYGTNQ